MPPLFLVLSATWIVYNHGCLTSVMVWNFIFVMLETCALTHIRALYHFKMLLLAEVIGRGTLWRALRHYPFKSYKHTSAADWILQCCWHNTRHTYRCLKMEESSVFFAIFEPKSVREWCLVGEAWRRHLGTTRDTALLSAGSRLVLNR